MRSRAASSDLLASPAIDVCGRRLVIEVLFATAGVPDRDAALVDSGYVAVHQEAARLAIIAGRYDPDFLRTCRATLACTFVQHLREALVHIAESPWTRQ